MPSLLQLTVLLALLTLVTPTANAYSTPLTPMASRHTSKLLVQSPSLEHVYMDYVVTSKPLRLLRYNKNGGKTKKTKKDSKIYFIPIPPLPYRYIPGVGYDYQPMRIVPIGPEGDSSTSSAYLPRPSATQTTTRQPTQSKLHRVQHHKDYYFNGRPSRLQAAHADRKSGLTALNLKSKLYYNKNIIY
ncbi:CG13856 [Drosophila busckii]|uniref:CG13856 n=1 Tax=Drosophila busckii TaxID=30019 RepID=A0A0M4EP95_DROBS|nr:uncharacterized protein LOC108603063 [Drosophila busckii]ALC47577.1 CG13856 [Drosophila busckii]